MNRGSVFGLLFGFLPSCSSSGGSPGAPVDGGGGSAGSASTGGAAGSGGLAASKDAATDQGAPTRTMCPFGQAACGQHCFTNPGEQFGKCTLVAVPGGNDSYRYAGWDEQAFYVITLLNGLFKVDKASGQATSLGKAASYRGNPVVDGGFIYVGANVPSDGGTSYGLHRLPATGGPPQFLTSDGIADDVNPAFFTVVDGALYFAAKDGLRSVPVTGGASTLVLKADVDSLVADATNLYYHSNFPEFDVRLAPRSNPSASTELVPNMPGADVFLWPSDPDNVYVMTDTYQKVPRAGGTVAPLGTQRFTFIGATQGKSHLLLDEVTIIYAMSADGQTVDVIDRGTGQSIGLFEDDASYYMVTTPGIFRIAK